MSLFTSRVGTTPNRVEMLIEFLQNNTKSLTRKELKELFSPKDDSTAFNDVYGFCQLFKITIIVNDIVTLNVNKKNSNASIIKEVLFNSNLIKDDNFLEVLSWLLSQNQDKLIDRSTKVRSILIADLNNEIDEELSEQAWQNFIYWAEYLGFASKLPIGNMTYILPDPTIGIKEELNTNFQKDTIFTVKDFFIKLSANLPVLEYGYIREKINQMLRDGLALPSDTLSYSTSLAMLRLEQQDIISLESKSDADIITLQDGINNRRISHIRYLGQ